MQRYVQKDVGETITSMVFLVRRKRTQPQNEQEFQDVRTAVEIGESLSVIKDHKGWGVVSVERLPADVIVHLDGDSSLLVFAEVWRNQKSTLSDDFALQHLE